MIYSNINDIISKYNNLLINYNKFFFNNIISYKNNNLSKNIYIKGINLIENVFNISFLYLDNLGDIYNLCEKSYIYFIEFINQINISNNIENNIDLTIKDAIIFCYKKTILNFENNVINKNNNINCIILNKITRYIKIINNLNIIYSIELHNIDNNSNSINIDNNSNSINNSNNSNSINDNNKNNDNNEEENTNKVLNIKLSTISKKITYIIKKITNNKNSYNNLENDDANISDKSTNNLSFFINYIFEYILNISHNNNLDYQIFYNIIDKYISKDIYNNNNNTNNSLLPINNYENIISNNNTQYCYENRMHSNREDIIKELHISYEESYNGSIKPLNIQRQLLNNNIIKYENETIYINIPQGIDNEELIIVNNKGNVFNGNYSNVKIIIKLLKHPDFYREGLDIYYNTSISFKESLVGFNFILKHLNNKNYKIENKINTIVHNNSKIILKKLGFIRDGFIGNLYVTFNINYPKLLDVDTIQKLKEIL